MILNLIFIIGTVGFVALVILFPSIAISTVFNFRKILREALSNNKTFMRWLYGDEYEESISVKVYKDGWRKGDYK